MPTLAVADAVYFTQSPPGLRCQCDAQSMEFLESAISTLLRSRGIAWHCDMQKEPVAALPALWSDAAAVLTLLVPAGVPLPSDIAVVLADANLELHGMRRLNPPALLTDYAMDDQESLQGERALELYFQDGEACDVLRPQLLGLAERWEADLTLFSSACKRPRRRLVAFDMDSTLIQCEVIDELARHAGVGASVAAITARAMRGELDFCSSFQERMGHLAGLSDSVLDEIARTLPIMPGAQTLLRTLRAQGHYTVILSGGFDYFARRVQQHLGINEVHANCLEIQDGVLTGKVRGQIIDGARKVELLEQVAREQGFAMEDTVTVGDGANDLPMLAAAGLGVAFHAKPLVREQAPCAIMRHDLNALLYLFGVSRS